MRPIDADALCTRMHNRIIVKVKVRDMMELEDTNAHDP